MASSNGDFVVTWDNYQSSTSTGFNIFARQFGPGGVPLAGTPSAAGEFQVNEPPSQLQPSMSPPTIGWQMMPSVGVDSLGNFTITWTSYGQDNAEVNNPSLLDYGIYARMYNANGTDFFDTALNKTPLEFRVNATTGGNQVAPAVSRGDAAGDSFIVWVGPDTSAAGGTAIYSRVVDPPPPAVADPVLPNTVPVVTQSPESVSVNAGATASFSAVATARPAAAVQWQVSTNKGASYVNIGGAISSTYSFAASAAQSGNMYRAIFTNSGGSTPSSVATLTVNGTTVQPSGTAPVVTTNPASQTIASGASVTFTAAATGSPTPAVQWQVKTPGGSDFFNISGATSASYTFTSAAAQSANLYRAVFVNSAGLAVSSPATLTIGSGSGSSGTNPGAPVVTSNPSSVTGPAATPVSFTAAASGSPTPAMQWQVRLRAAATSSTSPARPRRAIPSRRPPRRSGNLTAPCLSTRRAWRSAHWPR